MLKKLLDQEPKKDPDDLAPPSWASKEPPAESTGTDMPEEQLRSVRQDLIDEAAQQEQQRSRGGKKKKQETGEPVRKPAGTPIQKHPVKTTAPAQEPFFSSGTPPFIDLESESTRPARKKKELSSLSEITGHGKKAIPALKTIRKTALDEYAEPAPETVVQAPVPLSERIMLAIRSWVKPQRSVRKFAGPPALGDIQVTPPGVGEVSRTTLPGDVSPADKFIPLSELQRATPRADAGRIPDPGEMRADAMTGYTDPDLRSDSQRFKDRVALFFERIPSLQKKLLTAGVILGLIAVAAVLVLINLSDIQNYIWDVKASSIQTPTYPYPVRVTLPGELGFDLHQGVIQDGMWFPHGAEWLQGTEICRWVALPWKKSTEAAVLALGPDDPISLSMSNSDQLVYKVESIRSIDTSSEKVSGFNSQKPCLMLFLIQKDSSSRWVVTAIP
jgi:hypothetical protein